MPTADQVRQYLTLVVLPLLAGAVANWLLVHVHLLAEFHVDYGSVAAAVTQLGVFTITAAVTWLTGHHVLRGSYATPFCTTSVTLQPIPPPAPAESGAA